MITKQVTITSNTVTMTLKLADLFQLTDNIKNKNDNEEEGIEAFSANSNSTSQRFDAFFLLDLVAGILNEYSNWLVEQLKSNWLLAATQGWVYAIQLDGLIWDFKNFFDVDLVEIYESIVKENNQLLENAFGLLIQSMVTSHNVLWLKMLDYDFTASFKNVLFTIIDIFDLKNHFSAPISFLDSIKGFFNNFSEGSFYLDGWENIIVSGVKFVVDIVSIFLGPVGGFVLPPLLTTIIDVITLMGKGLISPIG